MDIYQSVEQHISILEWIELRNTNYTHPSLILAEGFLPIVEKRPFINKGPEKALYRNNFLEFAENLPPGLKEPLFSTIGKNTNSMKHPNASFTSKYRFRHLVHSCTQATICPRPTRKTWNYVANWQKCSPLWGKYTEMSTPRESVDFSPTRTRQTK